MAWVGKGSSYAFPVPNQKMSNQVVCVDEAFVGPVMPAKVPMVVSGEFSIRISPESKRLIRDLVPNEKTGAIRFAFLPIKSKKTADVCTLLGCGQSDAKRAVRKARKEIGVAWCAMVSASAGMGKHLFRSGVIGKSGAISITFDAGDGDDTELVAALEAKDSELETLKAKLAALEAPKA